MNVFWVKRHESSMFGRFAIITFPFHSYKKGGKFNVITERRDLFSNQLSWVITLKNKREEGGWQYLEVLLEFLPLDKPSFPLSQHLTVLTIFNRKDLNLCSIIFVITIIFHITCEERLGSDSKPLTFMCDSYSCYRIDCCFTLRTTSD